MGLGTWKKAATICLWILLLPPKVQTTSRKAKLAYVDSVAKPPREVQRAQDKNGTAPVQAPSVRETVKKMGGPPRPRGEGRRADGFQAAAKAKKSPMMLKSLKLMHGIKTNFRKWNVLRNVKIYIFLSLDVGQRVWSFLGQVKDLE